MTPWSGPLARKVGLQPASCGPIRAALWLWDGRSCPVVRLSGSSGTDHKKRWSVPLAYCMSVYVQLALPQYGQFLAVAFKVSPHFKQRIPGAGDPLLEMRRDFESDGQELPVLRQCELDVHGHTVSEWDGPSLFVVRPTATRETDDRTRASVPQPKRGSDWATRRRL